MKSKFFDIEGKKAIITGASQGLGNGMAEGLMEEGVEVVILDINPHTPEIAEKYCNDGYKCHGIVVNLGDEQQRKNAFGQALLQLDGSLDIIVNAAGIQKRHKSEEFPLKDWNAVLNINLTAVFSMCQMAGQVMLKQGHGKIINIASMLSFFGGYTVPAYAASKGGVAQITKAFANEWACRGININALAPGYMATEMNVALIHDDVRNAEILSRIPAKRWGTPKDVAGVVCFLSSPASDYLNGAIIPVDGGYLVR